MWWILLLIFQIIIAKTEYVTDDPTSIINGDLANVEDYPYYVYLRENDEKLICGGSLIQPNIVLTAAHCLGVVDFTVYVGITSDDDFKEAETYKVDHFLIHPLYDDYSDDKIHDIGLIRLTKDVVYGVKVRPIELADFKPPVNEQVTVIGFGKVVCDDFSDWWSRRCQNPSSTHLRKGIMNVTAVGEHVIDVVSVEQVACYGDSGGPMIYDDQLVGIASTVNTYECTRGNSYTPIDEHIPWIREYIAASNGNDTTEKADHSTAGTPHNATAGAGTSPPTTEYRYNTTKYSYSETTERPHYRTSEIYGTTTEKYDTTTREIRYNTTEDFSNTPKVANATENTYAAEILTLQQEILLIQQKIFTIQQKIYRLEQNIIEDCNKD